MASTFHHGFIINFFKLIFFLILYFNFHHLTCDSDKQKFGGKIPLLSPVYIFHIFNCRIMKISLKPHHHQHQKKRKQNLQRRKRKGKRKLKIKKNHTRMRKLQLMMERQKIQKVHCTSAFSLLLF